MQYRSGTVSIATGSNSLIGHDVDWSDIPLDSIFAVPLTPGTFRVQRVVSATEIELATVWTGAPLVDARYWITTDFTPFNGLPLPGRGDLESTRIISEALIALDGMVGGAPMGAFSVLDKDLNEAPYGLSTGAPNLASRSRASSSQVTLPTPSVSRWGFKLNSAAGVHFVSVGPLKTGTAYSVSFKARLTAGPNPIYLSVDLFPDTLPETQFTITSTPTVFKWENVTSSHADMTRSDVLLRFFQPAIQAGYEIEITDIKVEEGATVTEWSPSASDIATVGVVPSERASYIIGTAPTGVWQNRAGQIATFRRGLWTFATASDGAFIKVVDENKFYAYRASSKTWELNPLTNIPATTWASITGKPTTFTPSAHVHAASDVTSGTFHLDRIPVIPATKISGVLSVDQIPVMPSQKQFAAATLAALTAAQQAEIGQGSVVTTDDGYRSIYKGSGSKTDPASYTVLADITPEWDAISNRPTIFPSNIANVSGLQTELTNLQNSINSKSITWAAIPDKPTTLMRTDLVNTITGGVGGEDGGEIRLARAPSGTTLQGDIVIDVWQNSLRFLESQGSNRGAYLPLNLMANGANARIWTSADFNPTTFAANSHLHAIADVNGLQTALDATLKTNAIVKVQGITFSANNAFFYQNGENIHVRTGAAGAEKYFDFRADGSFWTRSGPIYSMDNRVWDAGNLSQPAQKNVQQNFTAHQTFDAGLRIGTQFGVNAVVPGNGDEATYALHNFRIKGWFGMGMESFDGAINGVYDFRAGRWDVKGGYRVNGQDVWHRGTLTPADLNLKNQFRKGQVIADGNGRQLKFKTDQGALNYGAMWHLDGSRFYLLLTNKDDADGDFNGLRPIHFGLADGGVVMGHSLEVQGNGLNVTGLGLTVGGNNGIAVSGDGGFRVTAQNGRGLRFWDSDSFKIYMSATNDGTWGGRVNTPYDPDTTSDYNIYFRNGGGGTNRGFVYRIDNTNVASIGSNGFFRSLEGGIFSNRLHVMSKTVTSDVWNGGLEIQEVQNVGNTQNHHSYAPALTFHWKNVCARSLWMGSDAWLYVGTQGDKSNLGNLGVNRISSDGNELWLEKNKVTKLKLTDFGASVEGQLNVSSGRIQLFGDSPTIYFRDANARSGMIHVNNGRMYFLRGSGANAEGWESTGSGWPFEINLENNDAYFGGQVYGPTNGWFRVRQSNDGAQAGIYWETWGGGWYMQDGTWMRTYQDKSIVTGGDIQANDYIVTSDRRLKTNIVPLTGSRELIQKTETKSYEKRGRAMVGLIAQEVQEYAPHMVREGGEILEDGTPALTLDLMQFIPHLLAEVKALRQEVETLKAAA